MALTPTIAGAYDRLRLRADVRRVESVARRTGADVWAVGGAVRSAFLGLPPTGDLDLVLPRGQADSFAERLALELQSRAVTIGARGRRVIRIPWRGREVDIWEEETTREKDRERRDFTVNALSIRLPGGEMAAPPGALEDLSARLLRPPRPGVYLEDPVRVLRAARFVAELPGFRLARGARPEIRQAVQRLRSTAPERWLTELDRLLSAPPARAVSGLRLLESWGALAFLIPGSSRAERSRGVRMVGRAEAATPAAVRRVLLLSPLGTPEVRAVLDFWKVRRRDVRLGETLAGAALRRADHEPTPREVVESARALAPFVAEGAAFLQAAGDRGTRRLAAPLSDLARHPSRLARILKPARPISAVEVAALLSLPPGPRLGAVLAALDVALAAREVRGRRQARSFLEALRSLTLSGSGATVNPRSAGGARS